MSRAFPFPPPAYKRNLAYHRDLVESTKIEQDTEVTKTDVRKGKKERREKKKERKEKERKYHKTTDGYRKKDNEKYCHFDQKKVEDDTEQLERSSLTEEHEQPQNHCYLSDGTQSNNKRKIEDLPSIQCQNQGKPPLRVRFVLRKPKESLNEEQICSTSGAGLPEGTDARTNTTGQRSVSEVGEKPQLDTKKVGSGKPTFGSLFENWLPQELKFQLNDKEEDDQEWLFGSKKRAKSDVKSIRKEDVGKSCGSTSWPEAQFLPSVGMYSLPYTIPF